MRTKVIVFVVLVMVGIVYLTLPRGQTVKVIYTNSYGPAMQAVVNSTCAAIGQDFYNAKQEAQRVYGKADQEKLVRLCVDNLNSYAQQFGWPKPSDTGMSEAAAYSRNLVNIAIVEKVGPETAAGGDQLFEIIMQNLHNGRLSLESQGVITPSP